MGQLRIIAGQLRGRRIPIPAGVAVRPTGDRVREALFSIIGARVENAAVLDAYAGSGALGLEALSRGARAVTFIEQDRRLTQALRACAERCGVAERCAFLEGPAVTLLDRGAAAGPFELILADPPYDSVDPPRFLALAAARLAPGGWVVLERDSTAPPPEGGPELEQFRSCRYARAALHLYRPSSR